LAAAAGAVFGSLVPGLGTVVGAVAGIGIGLLLETNAGKNFKNAVETGIKEAYDGIKNFGTKMFKGVFG
jgi:gas vesicle protein